MDNEKIKQMGRRIRHIRKSNKITQEKLAELIGVSVPYISNIENGKINASAEIIIRLAKALHTSADSILCIEINESDKNCVECFSNLITPCTSVEQEEILEIVRIVVRIIENKYWKT